MTFLMDKNDSDTSVSTIMSDNVWFIVIVNVIPNIFARDRICLIVSCPLGKILHELVSGYLNLHQAIIFRIIQILLFILLNWIERIYSTHIMTNFEELVVEPAFPLTSVLANIILLLCRCLVKSDIKLYDHYVVTNLVQSSHSQHVQIDEKFENNVKK